MSIISHFPPLRFLKPCFVLLWKAYTSTPTDPHNRQTNHRTQRSPPTDECPSLSPQTYPKPQHNHTPLLLSSHPHRHFSPSRGHDHHSPSRSCRRHNRRRRVICINRFAFLFLFFWVRVASEKRGKAGESAEKRGRNVPLVEPPRESVYTAS